MGRAEKKIEARELARARSGSARLGAARGPRVSQVFKLVGATSEPNRTDLAHDPAHNNDGH